MSVAFPHLHAIVPFLLAVFWFDIYFYVEMNLFC
jgi:hypothetical protein